MKILKDTIIQAKECKECRCYKDCFGGNKLKPYCSPGVEAMEAIKNMCRTLYRMPIDKVLLTIKEIAETE